MTSRRIAYIFCTIVFINSFNTAKAQGGLCPPNLDFEYGNFTNWLCQTGSVAVVGGVNRITWTGNVPVPGRHTIISAANSGYDYYGGFPESCPNGSAFSVKLGNNLTGHEAEGISYTYAIPAGIPVFSMFFHYAVVLQNPGHAPEEQPRFRARIFNVTDNTTIGCVTFDFTASSSLPGFVPSRVDPAVLYKDWTPITLNLTGYAGKTIQLEFITSDCTLGGHFGYAYVDVNTNCNGAIGGSTICIGDTSITLTAPYGFQSYQWYSDITFTQLLATTQTLTLNPPPSVGTIFPVIVSPYPGFGCGDTLYARISISPKPVSNAGIDASVCQNQMAQIGGPGTLGYIYSWTPASQVSNPIIPNPLAWTFPPDPTEFVVKTTDILTGCYSYDTTVMSTLDVDTSIQISGNTEFCDGATGATLSVSSSSAAVQWFDNNNVPIPGATSFTYQPLATGGYWAQVTQSGCVDSTATIPIMTHALPQASFYPNSDTGCITNNSFLFTNTSTVSDNAPMTYTWKFSDGSSLQTQDATKSFLSIGTYTAALVTATSFGCKDSIQHSVMVFPNGVPNFSWDSVCTNRAVLFKNLSNEKGATLANYNWDFKNGGAGSLVKDPLPVTYTTPGPIDVTLKITTIGCETDPKTVSKRVLVNAATAGIRYRDITVPLGSSKFINVRGNVGNIYNWRPQLQLNNYSSRYTQFNAISDDVQYLIDITDPHTCITTDTLQMLVLKKPGYYLPTAFTPNGDGLNDVAKPYLIGMKSLKSFSVYNRWGNLVFNTMKYGEGWDGKFKGTAQDAGVYIWVLEFIDMDDKTVIAKGTITLIR